MAPGVLILIGYAHAYIEAIVMYPAADECERRVHARNIPFGGPSCERGFRLGADHYTRWGRGNPRGHPGVDVSMVGRSQGRPSNCVGRAPRGGVEEVAEEGLTDVRVLQPALAGPFVVAASRRPH